MTSCLTCLDSAVLLNLNYQQICLFGQILTGGQLYSDTSTHKVSEFPLYLTNHRTYEDLSDSFVELEGSVGEGWCDDEGISGRVQNPDQHRREDKAPTRRKKLQESENIVPFITNESESHSLFQTIFEPYHASFYWISVL